MRVEMSVDNCESSLKMESKYMQDIFKAVSRGMGILQHMVQIKREEDKL